MICPTNSHRNPVRPKAASFTYHLVGRTMRCVGEKDEAQRHNQQPQTTHTHHGVINKHTTEKQTKSSQGTPGWFRNDEKMMTKRAKSKQMPLENKTTTMKKEKKQFR